MGENAPPQRTSGQQNCPYMDTGGIFAGGPYGAKRSMDAAPVDMGRDDAAGDGNRDKNIIQREETDAYVSG